MVPGRTPLELLRQAPAAPSPSCYSVLSSSKTRFALSSYPSREVSAQAGSPGPALGSSEIF